MGDKNRDRAKAVASFTERVLTQADALCDEWNISLDALLTALDTCKNRILIARMASLVAEGQNLELLDEDEDDEAGDEG